MAATCGSHPSVVYLAVCGHLGRNSRWLLPSPLKIWRDGTTDMPRVWMHMWATVRLMCIGFSVGALGGVLVAGVLHRLPFVKAGFYPLLILISKYPCHRIGSAVNYFIWFWPFT